MKLPIDTQGDRNRRASTTSDTIEIRQIFLALWHKKWLILLAGVIGALVAAFLVSRVDAVYTARASVMLDPRTVRVLSSDDVVSDLNLNNPLLDTEAAVLRSNLLLEEVIASFPAEDLAGFDPANQPVSWLSRQKAGLRNIIKGAPETAIPEDAVPRFTPEEQRMRRLLGALRQSMTVRRDGQSYLIAVAVETTDPDLSAALANRIVQKYIERQVGQLTDTVGNAKVFLTGQVEELRAAVEAAEAAVEDYRITQLAAGGVSAEAISQQLMDVSTQVALARAERASAEARFAQIQSVIDESGIEAAAELLTSPFVLSLRERKFELEQQDADLATQFGPNNRDRVSLRASIDAVSAELTREVRKIVAQLRNDVSVAEIRQVSLASSLAQLEGTSADISRASLELRQLEREAEAVRASYQSALERLNEVRSMAELQRGDARIVERAIVPGGPSGPRVVLFTMLGAVLGLTAAMLYVFIRTLSETTFTRPGQVEEATGLPVAASLPVGQWHRRNLRSMLRSLRRHPYQKYVERLRQLRFGLVFNDEEEETVRSVLFTSSVPNEGKTSLSVSFARLEAVSKRKCILVDFDMRRSTLARELGYKPRGGDLAAYFRGEVALEDAIAPLPGIGFDLLTTLKPYPRFADEMDPAWVKALLERLYQSYDMVVLDTPPLIAVPDTLSLVKAVDASVLLVKQGSTHRSAVQESARRLSEMGAHSVRVAMTMTDVRQEADTYGYSGSYTYGTK